MAAPLASSRLPSTTYTLGVDSAALTTGAPHDYTVSFDEPYKNVTSVELTFATYASISAGATGGTGTTLYFQLHIDEVDASQPFAHLPTSTAPAMVPLGVSVRYHPSTVLLDTHWLPCDGASVARASYPALADALGVADNAVFFNVPNVADHILKAREEATVYSSHMYRSLKHFPKPLAKLSRWHVRMLDPAGQPFVAMPEHFLRFEITCLETTATFEWNQDVVGPGVQRFHQMPDAATLLEMPPHYGLEELKRAFKAKVRGGVKHRDPAQYKAFRDAFKALSIPFLM